MEIKAHVSNGSQQCVVHARVLFIADLSENGKYDDIHGALVDSLSDQNQA